MPRSYRRETPVRCRTLTFSCGVMHKVGSIAVARRARQAAAGMRPPMHEVGGHHCDAKTMRTSSGYQQRAGLQTATSSITGKHPLPPRGIPRRLHPPTRGSSTFVLLLQHRRLFVCRRHCSTRHITRFYNFRCPTGLYRR
jgi:hypothetical protein